MAKANMEITLDVVLLETGIWCDNCLKSTKIRYGIYWLRDNGINSMGTRVVCAEERVGETA